MRINTAESQKTAQQMHERFGSWKAARDSARFKDGRYIVSLARTQKTEDK